MIALRLFSASNSWLRAPRLVAARGSFPTSAYCAVRCSAVAGTSDQQHHRQFNHEASSQLPSIAQQNTGDSIAGLMAAVTPLSSLSGGLCIGAAASLRLAINGRVTGISGIYGGLIRGDFAPWRLAFVTGLLAGGAYMVLHLPHVFPVVPASYTVARAAAAGALVGFGSSLGSGCTSGHGICGLARFSKRSFAAVLTFMFTGAVVALMTNSAEALGSSVPQWPSPWWNEPLGATGTSAAAALASVLVLRALAVTKLAPMELLSLVTDFVSGIVFAIGLGMGGMLNPAKVAAFLSPFTPYFDPSLAAVMGGGLLLTAPTFQFFMRGRKLPACGALNLPTASALDWKLLSGAAIFGTGWGLGGVCPGPALVNLAAPTPQGAVFVAAMSAAMLIQPALVKSLIRKPVKL